MSSPIAYLNGKLLPADQATVPVFDGGFVQGTTVAEQLRTFGGKLFRVEAHLDRLAHSLAIVDVALPVSRDALIQAMHEVATHNHAQLSAGDDLGLTVFVTPGPYSAMLPPGNYEPTVCVHTFPLAFRYWAHKYEAGEALVTTDVVQVPTASWPAELKCRSRMHYYLADKQARQRDPGARALMRDDEGFVTEATTANILLLDREGQLVTPPSRKILPGISLAVLEELARGCQIATIEQDITAADVVNASEVLLTSTSPCVLPVSRFELQPLAGSQPGPIQRRLIAAWSELVGVDIPGQAQQFAHRIT